MDKLDNINDICNNFKNLKIQNKKKSYGGGKNTNFNGLNYEKITSLENKFTILDTYNFYTLIKFNIEYDPFYILYDIIEEKLFKKINKFNDLTFIYTKQADFFKYINTKIQVDKKNIAHGCKKPDECFINENKKLIFWIEKKFQNKSGSVCEKIQTVMFKKEHLNEIIYNYKIIYILCLSDWYKTNTKVELKYLKKYNIPFFWGSDINYKNNIINFIINYK